MDHESVRISYSDAQSHQARKDIFERIENYPGTPEETERSLGLFLRGSLLARIFAIQEAYKLILGKPGYVFDVGTWRGQTAVLCENLRAIYEPLNFSRKIIAFDTFEGYIGFSDQDRPTQVHHEGSYSLNSIDYRMYLEKLIVDHEKSNAMGHNFGKHQVIQGDCRLTIQKYFDDNPNAFVALAFLDVNSYGPTSESVAQIWPRLIPGGYLAIWQLTRDVIPAEGHVYRNEMLTKLPHEIVFSETYPGLTFIKKI
jgi:hypothetical protein